MDRWSLSSDRGLTPVLLSSSRRTTKRRDNGLDAEAKVGKAPSVTTPWTIAGKARKFFFFFFILLSLAREIPWFGEDGGPGYPEAVPSGINQWVRMTSSGSRCLTETCWQCWNADGKLEKLGIRKSGLSVGSLFFVVRLRVSGAFHFVSLKICSLAVLLASLRRQEATRGSIDEGGSFLCQCSALRKRKRYIGSVPPACTPLHVKWIPDGVSRQRVVGKRQARGRNGASFKHVQKAKLGGEHQLLETRVANVSVWGMGDHLETAGISGGVMTEIIPQNCGRKPKLLRKVIETRIEMPSGVVGARDHLNSRGS
ncbi:hypothetical protein B0T20DRAFT_391019 [Sordaria brevicollis]|uniref:Uncharacterized protein n=1 Tax=Sordaria brevicollis TaxID=83679 RepID=A0AAE0PJS4_SORBR|nr:hypothetical protein B0T20DRAFT_391019 [Sordaria brevicollis]